MKIYESGENYLETIYLLREKNSRARSIDVAEELGFSRPSVSRAMSILKANELITIDQKGNIEFTEAGLQLAKDTMSKHLTIRRFLENLGVEREIADKDACRIEHIISAQTFEKIKKSVETK
ncbi:MAG: metal-dependent transcriptional regulator [Clostridia bacterium]